MEQEGWDYSHARKEGRNVFVFRDTSHVSAKIHENLYSAIYSQISRGIFSTLFIEGGEGPISPIRVPEEVLRVNVFQKAKRCIHASELLSCRHHSEIYSGKFKIYGAEGMDILNKQREAVRASVEFGAKVFSGHVPSFLEEQQFDFLEKRVVVIARRRSFLAAERVIRQMEVYGENNVGMLFGDGHYTEIIQQLKRREAGYVTFSPSWDEKNFGAALEYLQTL
ncbi:MAG: hypothetical protein WCI72_01085 [archaeon]